MRTCSATRNRKRLLGNTAKLGSKITAMMFDYPKPVAVCVLSGVMAAVSVALGVPRDLLIQMLESALEAIGETG